MKASFPLEQVTRVELAGSSLGSCRHTARRHLHVFIIYPLTKKSNRFFLFWQNIFLTAKLHFVKICL